MFENDIMMNGQDFDGTFKLLDDTLANVFPRADIRLAPLIATKEKNWLECELSQNAFRSINKLIKERKHVKLDSFAPTKRNWICHDKVHFKDFDGVKFWKKIFAQLED